MRPPLGDARIDRLRQNLCALQGGRSDEEMAYKIRAKDPKTWRTRKMNPETLTMREFILLCRSTKRQPGDLLERELI